MKKKFLLFLLVCGLVMGLGNVPNVQAYPVFEVCTENELYFNNAETWVDVDGDSEISAGDYFYGILHVQNIDSTLPLWNEDNVTPGLDTFTGYFLTEVTNTALIAGIIYQIDLGPYTLGASDPMGGLTDAEIAQGVVMKMWTDTSTQWQKNGDIADDISRSTDGDPWATFTTTDDGYWYTNAPVVPPVTGTVGSTLLGLNVVTDYTGIFGYGLGPDVNDPNEYRYDLDVDMYATGEIEVNSRLTYWGFLSNDPAVFHPVPEPATMLLLGSGLIGLAVLGRKKNFFKKD